MGVMKLDDTDKLIVQMLRQDSRRSLTEIAYVVGLSRPSVKSRIDKLVDAQIIRRFTIDVALPTDLTNPPVQAMFDVKLKRNSCAILYGAIKNWPEVVAVWSISGEKDMRISLEAPSQSALETLRERIARHHEVVTITTSFVLKTWCARS